MAKLTIFVSQTIVLFLIGTNLWASPSPEVPQAPITESPSAGPPLDDSLVISDVGPITKPQTTEASYYPYRQQFTFRVGTASELSRSQLTDTVIGFQYLLPKFLSPKWEAGADLHKEGQSHLSFGLRWIIDERSYFRPSFKLSVDHRLQPEHGLVSFAHYDNYFARATGTLEYVFASPYSIRLEPEVMVGLNGYIICVTLGLSHGW